MSLVIDSPTAAPAPRNAAQAAPRAAALDALRGLAIIMMVLSGIIPYRVLPSWMYHAQVPPPTHTFDPSIAGITWVDLVFPFFLFALGVAIPLALGRRLASGASRGLLVKDLTARAALLLFFAVFLQHVRPGSVGGGAVYEASAPAWPWIVALLGFACLWGILLRLPQAWPRLLQLGWRAGGWLGALALLATLRYPDGSGFQLGRYDIIIVVLANMALVGSVVWLSTRSRPGIRYGVLAFLAAAIIAGREPGWVRPLMETSILEGLFRVYYLKYLFIVVPGLFVGEWLADWMRSESTGVPEWTRPAAVLLATLGIVLQVLVVVGLFARLTPWVVAGSGALGIAALWLTRHAASADAVLVRQLWRWGLFWLLLGLVAEPFEGGIRKDHSTFSYYFVTVGLAMPLLASLMLIITRFGRKMDILVANGQNPMVAYVAFGNFLLPVLTLTGIAALAEALTLSPWMGALRGALYTLVVALLVWGTVRQRWFWRT